MLLIDVLSSQVAFGGNVAPLRQPNPTAAHASQLPIQVSQSRGSGRQPGAGPEGRVGVAGLRRHSARSHGLAQTPTVCRVLKGVKNFSLPLSPSGISETDP
jgi:hypothetical protein